MSSAETATVTCPHGRACGACALLATTIAYQLDYEASVIRKALAGWKSLKGVRVDRPVASPRQEGYRNRAKMAVVRRDGGVALGYFQPRSRMVVDAPDCRVLIPELLETTRALRQAAQDLGTRRAGLPASLRFVDVRCGSDPTRQHLTLVVGDEREAIDASRLRRACPFVSGIGVNVNPGSGAQVIKGPVVPLWGEPQVRVELDAATLLVSPGSFCQVNLAMLGPAHAIMRDFLEPGGTLVDLYAGVGTHGLALRDRYERVVLVEGVSSAVRDARASIDASGAQGIVSVMGSPVERVLPQAFARAAHSVVLNPSREGCRPEVLDAISSRASRVAYLSCDPRTLARDLARLTRGRLEVVTVIPLQMMPQTRQVEALALLARRTASGQAESRRPRVT